jgi:uridine kinase
MKLDNYINYIKEIESKKLHPIIFVSGLAGSGKTTFTKKLVAEYKNAMRFELDWYLKYSSIERANRIKKAMDSGNKELIEKECNPINHFDFNSFKRDLVKLQQGDKLFVQNAWNQQTGEKDASFVLDFKGEKGLIICDADYVLHPEIISLSDFSIFLDVPKEEAFRRVVERDNHMKTPEQLERKRLIVEMYDLPYLKAYKKNASLIING